MNDVRAYYVAQGITEDNGSKGELFFYHTPAGWIASTLDIMVFTIICGDFITKMQRNSKPQTPCGRALILTVFLPWLLLTPFWSLCMLGTPTYDMDVAFETCHVLFTFVVQAALVAALTFHGSRCFRDGSAAGAGNDVYQGGGTTVPQMILNDGHAEAESPRAGGDGDLKMVPMNKGGLEQV